MVVARRGCGANGDDESDEPDTNGVVDGIEKMSTSQALWLEPAGGSAWKTYQTQTVLGPDVKMRSNRLVMAERRRSKLTYCTLGSRGRC